MSGESAGTGSSLRDALAEYVHALHESYVATAVDRGADVTDLPLAGAPFTVAIAAADQLHLVATRGELPRVRPHEEPIAGHLDPLHWTVRFLDSSVIDELGRTSGLDTPTVKKLLGIQSTLYHLMVQVDAALTPHQAVHAGAGLASAHLGPPEPDRQKPAGGSTGDGGTGTAAPAPDDR